ncbi:MAG: diguanylate cyclase [Gallionella sp.]|nr:diguanylate cyclase [Gallionella sp.]
MSFVGSPEFSRMRVSGRLPAPKGIALQVIQLTQQPEASNQALAKLISSDPAFSARVLKAANILFANSQRPVTTVLDAVMVLGVRGIRQLVFGIALISDYGKGSCRQFDYQRYWAASLLTGIAARKLVQQASLAAADEIFVVGLLGNIGKLALATVYPDEFGTLLAQSDGKTFAKLAELERHAFGFDESELAEAILADMNFPKLFQGMVRYVWQPGNTDAVESSREWRLLHLLHTAVLLAECLLAAPQDRQGLIARLKSQATRIAMDGEKLAQIGDDSLIEWREWSVFLNLGFKIGPESLTEILQTAESDAVTDTEAPLVHVMPNSYPLRTLVVEDDPATLKLLETILREAGHSVSVASNGAEALEIIAKELPQLVISDWMMPKMDGVTLCRKLRQSVHTSNLHVVLLTVHEDPNKLVEAFEAGVDDYLVKPVSPKILFARLRAAQRVIQLQEELAFDREQLQRFSKELTVANQRLQQLALTDELTGLPNRRAAMERITQEWSLTLRGDRPLSCLMVDIDHFKSVNDRFGHPVGDLALRHVAQILSQAARAQDVVYRFGGEEFLVVCPDTDAQDAYHCAERMRVEIHSIPVAGVSPPLQLTISTGVGSVKAGKLTLDELLSQADQRLYAAKQAGRNCTIWRD